MRVEGFDLLGDSKAKILILGSMPSVKSIAKKQYYGHPQNAFWRIMASLFNGGEFLKYHEGEKLLTEKGIAVWDVLKFCDRSGSLDANIKKETMEMNDFVGLFKAFPELRTVFFNGAAAERTYIKSVYPLLLKLSRSIKYTKLPSTSPAYAAMKFDDKLVAWSAVKNAVNDEMKQR